jgi:hypothetical protein
VAIDELFVRVSKNWLNPSSAVEAMLFLRCHAALQVLYNAKFELLGINAAMLDLRNGL